MIHSPIPRLQPQLDAQQRQVAAVIPAAARQALAEEIQRLVASNLQQHSLHPGDTAPDFALPNALGEQVAFADLVRQGPTIITFYRGEWCPYCNLQLRAYQDLLPDLFDLGAQLIAISPQTPDHSLSLAEKRGLAFPTLSDSGNVVAHQFGLVYTIPPEYRPMYRQLGGNLPSYNGDDRWEVPIPATFIIDARRRITFVHATPDYTQRLEPATLLEEVEKVVMHPLSF